MGIKRQKLLFVTVWFTENRVANLRLSARLLSEIVSELPIVDIELRSVLSQKLSFIAYINKITFHYYSLRFVILISYSPNECDNCEHYGL